MLKPADPAPNFKLPSSTGKDISLSDLRGRRVVLYFYPKDQTPGCTREACNFRDHAAKLRAMGVDVIGVSKDSLNSHDAFIKKYKLSFPLLSDADNAVARSYGAYGEKTLYGKKILGTIRSTFLIDPDGRVEAVWSSVKVDGHAEDVLARAQGKEAASTGKAKPAAKKAKKPSAKSKPKQKAKVKAAKKKKPTR